MANCFGELYARYTEKVYDLCCEEAYDEKRLYCVIDEDAGLCDLCDRHRFCDGMWLINGRWRWDTCDGEECRRLLAWYEAPTAEGGYKRRRLFKRHFGKILGEMPKELRKDAILTTMLIFEANEKELSSGNKIGKNARRAASVPA